MKTILALALLATAATSGHANAQSEAATTDLVYGLHLFFNEQEAVDVMTLKTDEQNNILSGDMHVPRDFDGKLDDLKAYGNAIEFDLFVPKNQGRPEDMVFHYQGTFFDRSREQIIGYVTLQGTGEFVASFVAFKRAGGTK